MDGGPGKTVGENTYVHLAAVAQLSAQVQSAIASAAQLASAEADVQFNVVKINADLQSISLLDYADFFEEAFPSLRQSWTVDLIKGLVRHRSFLDSFNPPILHRKELLLPLDHPFRAEFSALTTVAEQIGLFDDPIRIGFIRSWRQLLAQRGYKIIGHNFVPLGNDEDDNDPSGEVPPASINRHLTALTRYGFSAPIQSLGRHGFLDGTRTVFDYGCGRGDDLRGLRDSGVTASGWDPHYAPHDPKHHADIVNLGFVINVIENVAERVDALKGAYALANALLVVSVMIKNEATVRGMAFSDGIVTSRNTFQKYFTQAELKHFITEVLGEEPVPVGPGVMYVFKDKDEEQRFQYGQLSNRRNLLRLETRARPAKPTAADRAISVYQEHRDCLDELLRCCVALGRIPDPEEIPSFARIVSQLGSLPAALKVLKCAVSNTDHLIGEARLSRIDDLRVYLARLQFDRARTYRALEPRLQRDVKAFFGGFKPAQEAGRQLLASLSDTARIDEACRRAMEHGLGCYTGRESLQLQMSQVERLPAELRAYVECAAVLYGDLSMFDLVKIHVNSSKLTLMRFDDFENSPLPKMQYRVKIKLRTQDIETFRYGGDYPPPYLYEKSRFLNEESPYYAEQLAFEAALDRLSMLHFAGYGPPATAFDAALAQRRYRIAGFSLARIETVPCLDDYCGRHFTYRQLIECGETQRRIGISNAPKEPDTYSALSDLALYILDPVIEYFGMILLTYGFCSADLAQQIDGRIAPGLDQHAGHERARNGKFICKRLGASCDFLVEDEDMEGVARWIAANTPFDRIYFYGRDRPIHVSYGPENKREFVEMRQSDGERRIPKVRRDIPTYAAPHALDLSSSAQQIVE